MKRFFNSLIVLILLLLNRNDALGQAVVRPNVEEAVVLADQIIVARYQSHSPIPAVSYEALYWNGVPAQYLRLHVLKGKPQKTELFETPYILTNNYSCEAPPNFKMTEDKFPYKNSQWILFMEPMPNPWFYSKKKIDFIPILILPATSQNLIRVKALLRKKP